MLASLKLIRNMSLARNAIFNKLLLKKQVKTRSFNLYANCHQRGTQYEYDSKTDSFQPKVSPSKSYNHNQQQHQNTKNFSTFAKNTIQNVCLITGAIVWGGLIFVGLFVDIKEEDLDELDLDFFKGSGNQARLLAFYDLAQSKNDLLSLLNLEKSKGDNISVSVHLKGKAFLKAIAELKENSVIKESLGEQVHLCGYRAASKLDHMVTNLQSNSKNLDNPKNNLWNVECVIEGTKGLALVNMKFERWDQSAPWTMTFLKVNTLDSSVHSLLEDNNLLVT